MIVFDEDNPSTRGFSSNMIKHTSEKPVKSHYFFICACGCGQNSEDLGKEYVRLTKGKKWYSKDCGKGKVAVREFKGGRIIVESDF